jgi:hypothetical protein
MKNIIGYLLEVYGVYSLYLAVVTAIRKHPLSDFVTDNQGQDRLKQDKLLSVIVKLVVGLVTLIIGMWLVGCFV